jgi:hypothetical protein
MSPIEYAIFLIKREMQEMSEGWQEGSVHAYKQLESALSTLEALK